MQNLTWKFQGVYEVRELLPIFDTRKSRIEHIPSGPHLDVNISKTSKYFSLIFFARLSESGHLLVLEILTSK